MLLELDDDILEEVALLIQGQVIEPRQFYMEHLITSYGCRHHQTQQRRHADQESPTPLLYFL